eukprot:7060725-Pyramimonas_sp.AAC.1
MPSTVAVLNPPPRCRASAPRVPSGWHSLFRFSALHRRAPHRGTRGCHRERAREIRRRCDSA